MPVNVTVWIGIGLAAFGAIVAVVASSQDRMLYTIGLIIAVVLFAIGMLLAVGVLA